MLASLTREAPMPIEHFLFRRATVFPSTDRDLTPQDCHYDVHLGAWLTNDPTPRFLIESATHRAPGTKKQDLETGEDQKGA